MSGNCCRLFNSQTKRFLCFWTLNVLQFGAYTYCLRRCTSPCRFRAYLVQRGEPQ